MLKSMLSSFENTENSIGSVSSLEEKSSIFNLIASVSHVVTHYLKSAYGSDDSISRKAVIRTVMKRCA